MWLCAKFINFNFIIFWINIYRLNPLHNPHFQQQQQQHLVSFILILWGKNPFFVI